MDLPPDLVGVLCFGLHDNSRIKMKISGSKLTTEQTFLAMMVDSLNFIAWTKTEDARKNRKRPKSIIESLRNRDKECKGFRTIEEFERTLQQLRS